MWEAILIWIVVVAIVICACIRLHKMLWKPCPYCDGDGAACEYCHFTGEVER